MTENAVKINLPKSIFTAVGDEKLSKEMIDILKRQYNVENVKVVADGEEAWSAISGGDFDFIILDWKLPKVSGLVIFNRLKQEEKYKNVPVLVVSNLLQKENFVLLKDYFLTELVDGQFSEQTFTLKFELLQKEVEWFKTNSATLDGIAASMKDNPTKAKEDLDGLVKASPNPMPILNLAARRFRDLKIYKEAEEVLNSALKFDQENTVAVMEMSKIFHLTGRHKEALELMSKHKFSMKNIERLLLIGEINIAEKKPEEARKIFSDALSIDSANTKAQAGVIVADNLKNFLTKNDAQTLPMSFAASLNMIAISLIKSGKHEEGLTQYKAALAFVHDNISQARVMYNLGLGYLRWQKKQEALTWFQESAKTGGEGFAKASEYVTRLTKDTKTEEPKKEAAPDASIGSAAEDDNAA